MKIELRLEELVGFLTDGRTSIHAATITHEQANATVRLDFGIWWGGICPFTGVIDQQAGWAR